ncbi:MAG: OmpH family outer membrane protein [Crocinitomicaceae bacterium]|jgi:outer membrane protein|tara:strand:+ start:16317 stop:16829 length:513 start_codon:yes stop_codon:yes gene_type:complete
MLKYFFLLILFFGTTFAFSQSYAYIDSDYILSKVPEYTQAKEKLDKLAERWTKEIEDRYAAIETKKSNFEREEILLPNEEKTKRKEEIENLEQEALDLQTLHFGSEGDYFQKRQELIKPIQDRIYTALKKISKSDGYDLVFDKANQSSLIFAASEYDISDDILDEMGISE